MRACGAISFISTTVADWAGLAGVTVTTTIPIPTKAAAEATHTDFLMAVPVCRSGSWSGRRLLR
jgi:hypothetical protein